MNINTLNTKYVTLILILVFKLKLRNVTIFFNLLSLIILASVSNRMKGFLVIRSKGIPDSKSIQK